jgi:hypothetical protein
MPPFFIPMPSKIYPNWDFWCENKPPGNLVATLFSGRIWDQCYDFLNIFAEKNGEKIGDFGLKTVTL